jgi:hypothetical protein
MCNAGLSPDQIVVKQPTLNRNDLQSKENLAEKNEAPGQPEQAQNRASLNFIATAPL